jgi:hypothetical protein
MSIKPMQTAGPFVVSGSDSVVWVGSSRNIYMSMCILTESPAADGRQC